MDYRVNNLTEALKLAEKFQLEGTYQLFRGQSKDWEVLSTIQRLNDDSFAAKRNELNNLLCFFRENILLSKYVEQGVSNEFLAIAQHYGCATNFIDFTSDPKVAFHFATSSKNSKVGDECVIVCLNVKDFDRFNDDLEKHISFYSKRNITIPRILDVDISNLWRIQAQKGCFLELTFKGYDVFHYHFDRIYFPYDEPFSGIQPIDIYPDRKSPIEIELDKFFMNELMLKNNELLKSDNFYHLIYMPEPTIDEFNIVFKDYENLEIHNSWNTISNDWQTEKNTNWIETTKRKVLSIKYDDFLNSQERLIEFVDYLEIFKNELILIKIDTLQIESKLLETLSLKVNQIYDGMRVLPYTSLQIGFAIRNFLIITNSFDNLENKIEIEFGENDNGTGYYSRSFLLENDLSDIFREDIISHLNSLWVMTNLFENDEKEPNWDNINQKQIDDLLYSTSMFFLQLPLDIRKIASFDHFVNLFAEKIVPFQMYLNRQSVLYNPSIIRRIGRP